MRRGTLLAAAFWIAVAPAPAAAQRVQFPTPAQDPSHLFAPSQPSAGINAQNSLAPSWDPYADPSAQTQPLYPKDGIINPNGTVNKPQRFLHEIRFDHAWLNGDGGDDLGINELEVSGSFAYPFLANPAPVLVTPGFAVNYWDGPATFFPAGPPPMVPPADLPPRVYDAFLETSWQPVINQYISGDLAFRIGVYSDFEKVNSDSIRYIGRGAGLISFGPRAQIAVGAAYLDRQDTKILPIIGVVWTPNNDARWELVFPNPKIANRLTTWGNTDVWWYVAGEYGGGSWTIERLNGAADIVDYNDIRLKLGTEFEGFHGVSGYFEVGYVFDREVEYFQTTTPDFKPDDTFMLGGGLRY